MIEVKKLYDRVNNFNAKPEERYPELADNEPKKRHILYVSPFYNKQGLYRMILPALELNDTGHFVCIVTNIIPDDCTKTIDNFNIRISPLLIKWAHFIVFQANFQD